MNERREAPGREPGTTIEPQHRHDTETAKLSKKGRELIDKINVYLDTMKESSQPVARVQVKYAQYKMLKGKHPRVKLEVIQ